MNLPPKLRHHRISISHTVRVVRGSRWVCGLVCMLLAQGPTDGALSNDAPAVVAREPDSSNVNDSQGPADRSALPLADPVVDADAVLTANRAFFWSQNGARMLLLERSVSVQIGAYGFSARRAVVRIDKQTHPGGAIHHLAIYLDGAQPLHRQDAVQAQAPRLLVTASTKGRVQLVTSLLRPKPRGATDPLVDEAGQRISRYLQTIGSPLLTLPPGDPLFGEEAMSKRQSVREQIDAEALQRSRPARVAQAEAEAIRLMPPEPDTQAKQIMPPGGTVSYHSDKIIFQQGDGQDSMLVLVGNVRVMYQSPNRLQAMSLRAENAVIFLAEGAMSRLSGSSAEASDVHGVYLEDNVLATDNRYTIRAPRVYYDLQHNKAVVLEAVFYTWDVHHQVPLYVRAQKLQQESMTSWSAQGAVLTTSEFAQPHFAIASKGIDLPETHPPRWYSGVPLRLP